MTIRDYNARRDLLELHALLDAGMRPAEIARAMRKDPAWVSRSIKRLHEDPTLAFRKPNEGEAVSQMLSRLECLYQHAFRASVSATGRAKAGTIRAALAALQQLAEYQFRVGLVEEGKRLSPFALGAEESIALYETLLKQREEEEGPLAA